MLCFSIFLFSPLFHSVFSFTVCWALAEDSVSRRLTVLHVYVCVFMCIHKGTTGCISKVMVTNPYLFFFLLCVSSAILEKCVWIHLRKGPWLLRCDAPYHHFLYITYICLNNKNRFIKPASTVYCHVVCVHVLHVFITFVQHIRHISFIHWMTQIVNPIWPCDLFVLFFLLLQPVLCCYSIVMLWNLFIFQPSSCVFKWIICLGGKIWMKSSEVKRFCLSSFQEEETSSSLGFSTNWPEFGVKTV